MYTQNSIILLLALSLLLVGLLFYYLYVRIMVVIVALSHCRDASDLLAFVGRIFATVYSIIQSIVDYVGGHQASDD